MLYNIAIWDGVGEVIYVYSKQNEAQHWFLRNFVLNIEFVRYVACSANRLCSITEVAVKLKRGYSLSQNICLVVHCDLHYEKP